MPSCRLSSAFGALSALPVLKSVIRVPPSGIGPIRSITPTIVAPSNSNSNRTSSPSEALLAVVRTTSSGASARRPGARYATEHGLRGELLRRASARSTSARIASWRLVEPRPARTVLDHAVHELAHPGLVARRPAEPELVAQHVLQLAVLEGRHPRVARARASRAAAGRCRSSRAGTTTSRGRRPARAARRARRAGARPRRRGRRAGGARSRPPRAWTPARRTARSGAGGQVTPSSSTNRDRGVSSSASGCVSARRARRGGAPVPTTIRNRRRSSSSRARTDSDRDGVRSSDGQVEHRLGPRRGDGKLPSAAPATITVSNSRPTVPCAVSTCTASGPARVPCGPPRSVLARVEGFEERLHAGIATLARLGHGVRERDHGVEVAPIVRALRPGSLDQPARAGELLPEHAERVLDGHPGEERRLREGLPRRDDARRPRRDRGPRSRSSALGAPPAGLPPARGRIRPRAAAGESPTTSEVRSGSTSSSRSGRAGDEPPQREHVRVRRRLRCPATARARGRRAGPARRRGRGAGCRRARPGAGRRRPGRSRRRLRRRGGGEAPGRPRRAPRRCAARSMPSPQVRPRIDGGCSAGSARRRGRPPSRTDPGADAVVPWNEKTCASGSAATTRSGAARPRRTASAASVVS